MTLSLFDPLPRETDRAFMDIRINRIFQVVT